MNILGLNFGHDAAVAVLRDGHVAANLLRERQTGVKHALGLDRETVLAALAEAGLGVADIDWVAVTSTQNCEYIFDGTGTLTFRFETDAASHRHGTPMQRRMERPGFDLHSAMFSNFLRFLYEKPADSWDSRLRREVYPEHGHHTAATVPVLSQYLHHYPIRREWRRPCGLEALGRRRYYARLLHPREADHPRLVCPLTVELEGRRIPAYMVDHHIGHAAAAYYASGADGAAILTQDGFGDFDPVHAPAGMGLFCLGRGNRVLPLAPHFLNAGVIYHAVGRALGLGLMAAPGKLMGLAAYGRPRFMDRGFVGNWYDLKRRLPGGAGSVSEAWLGHCLTMARRLGYDETPYGDSDQALAPINADIAASTQLLFEETFLQAARVLWRIADGAVGDGARPPDTLCLSGGTALNCGTNSRLFNEGPFARVFVPPHCDDGGLAIGVAQYLHHSILDRPLVGGDAYSGLPLPYLGPANSGSAEQGGIPELSGVAILHPEEPVAAAARILADGGIIGWFEGRSEVGPRALGHRSILADPRGADVWARVNRLKNREMWRPLAPAVLAEDAESWFSHAPADTPFMLFNARVRSPAIPAVTHADGSARLQTVTPAIGGLYRLLTAFRDLTGVPVLLNTSLNGRGQPIVETPAQAARLFADTAGGDGLDALFIDGVQLVRLPVE